MSLTGTFNRLFPKERRLSWRARGDLARDERRWSDAAAAYRQHLKTRRRDADIWVQLGNCSKEAGDYTAALKAYDVALSLNERSADAHLQRGHLLKITQRQADAVEAFRRSYDLAPRQNPAFQELLAAGVQLAGRLAPGRDRPAAARAVIYIDVTDLIDYLKVNLSLSGIQRVVANLIEKADAFDGRGEVDIQAAYPDYNGMVVHRVPLDLVRALIDVTAARSSRDVINRAIELVGNTRVPVKLTPRDTLFIPGAFWIYQRYDLLNRLRQDGVRVTIFIHDLIQITNPEFVEPAATAVFRRSFVDVLSVASYLMCNSRFVGRDIERYLQHRMNFRIPVVPILLATELGSAATAQGDVSADIQDVLANDFVLYVSTIEIRKNHMYLIKIWEQLIADNAAWIPNLVFVGKWGWEIDELRKHLRQSDYLGGRLMIFNGISDVELAALYNHCQFTVYPSYAEGFGLPVGESLGYGKPCVASETTSIPEVGGDFCKYVDPFDWRAGYRVIADVLSDRAALDNWATTVRTRFKPKTWQAFAQEVFTVVGDFARDRRLDRPGNNCIVEPGEILTFGNDAVAQLDGKDGRLVTARMTRISGWHGIETWGCWAAKRHAVLRFRTTLPAQAKITLFLFLRTPEDDLAADCTVRCGGAATSIADLGPMPRWVTARGEVGPEGTVEVNFVSGRGFQHQHGRDLFVGISAIGLSLASDRAGRLAILDQIVPGGLDVEVTA